MVEKNFACHVLQPCLIDYVCRYRLVYTLLGIVLVCSCSGKTNVQRKIESRLLRTPASTKKTDNQKRIAADLLTTLQKITPDNIDSPTIAWTAVGKESFGDKHALALYGYNTILMWME